MEPLGFIPGLATKEITVVLVLFQVSFRIFFFFPNSVLHAKQLTGDPQRGENVKKPVW